MEESLERNFATGQPYPQLIAARDTLDLRRGFAKEHVRFKPDVLNDVNNIGKDTYHELSAGIHQAAPKSILLDQKISSLIPVRDRARLVDLQAGPGERILDRITRPTGGLVGPLLAFGKGGPLGAGAMLTAQELAASSTTKMLGARGLWGGGTALSGIPGTTAAATIPLVRRDPLVPLAGRVAAGDAPLDYSAPGPDSANSCPHRSRGYDAEKLGSDECR